MAEVNDKVVYTLQEIEKKLKVEQHRLIHLCEKGVIIPDFEDASGRGTMRRFSARNLFEFALSLELRRFSLTVAYIVPIVGILRSFEEYVRKEVEVFSLPRSLQEKPGLRVLLVITDGRHLCFILRHKGEVSYVNEIDLETMRSPKSAFGHVKISKKDPTHPFTSRLEVDLNRIAQSI